MGARDEDQRFSTLEMKVNIKRQAHQTYSVNPLPLGSIASTHSDDVDAI